MKQVQAMECLAHFEVCVGNYIFPFVRQAQKILYLIIHCDVCEISMRNEAEPDRLERHFIA